MQTIEQRSNQCKSNMANNMADTIQAISAQTTWQTRWRCTAISPEARWRLYTVHKATNTHPTWRLHAPTQGHQCTNNMAALSTRLPVQKQHGGAIYKAIRSIWRSIWRPRWRPRWRRHPCEAHKGKEQRQSVQDGRGAE